MNRPRSLSRRLRFAVLERDRFTCQYCGRRAPDVELHVDHVHPHSKGGLDALGNLVTACVDCNGAKADQVLAERVLRRISEDAGRASLDVLASVLQHAMPEYPWEGADNSIVNCLFLLCRRAESIAEWKRDVADLLRGLDMARSRGITLDQLEAELDVMFGNG